MTKYWLAMLKQWWVDFMSLMALDCPMPVRI